MKTRARPRIVVIGSLNIDYIATVDRLPGPGETVLAGSLVQRFGGKGANQAVAAARQGAQVTMIGCVGEDDSGRAYRQRLKKERVNTSGISSSNRALTGTALIGVDRAAENLIIVAPGANGELSPRAVKKLAASFKTAAALLLQFEIPAETVLEAIKLANRARVPVFLNPSPLHPGFPWQKCTIDTLIVNEHEAAQLFGSHPLGSDAHVPVWTRALSKKNIRTLVITRGARPTYCIDAGKRLVVPAMKVNPVDTVGAGDTFAGTFVARRSEGADLETAIRYANCAAALATLKPGAQESMPTRAATEEALRSAA